MKKMDLKDKHNTLLTQINKHTNKIKKLNDQVSSLEQQVDVYREKYLKYKG